MGYFPRPAAPRVLLADIRATFLGHKRHRLVFAALAVGMTSLVITGFIVESRSGVLPGRSVIYAASWSEQRTDSEIEAQQKIDQKEREAYKAEKRRQFQKVDDALTRLGI